MCCICGVINNDNNIYVGGAVKTSKSIKKSLRRLLPGGRRSSEHAHQDHVTSGHAHSSEQKHVNEGHKSADHAHLGGQELLTTDHATSYYANSGGQEHVTAGHVSANHAHHGGHDHVIISGHSHSGFSTNNVTAYNAPVDDADHVASDHVTTKHVHKEHVTNDASSSKHVTTPSPEILQPQQPDSTARVGYIRSEVVTHALYYVVKH